MQAAVFAGADVWCSRTPGAGVGRADDVLIEVEACGICGTRPPDPRRAPRAPRDPGDHHGARARRPGRGSRGRGGRHRGRDSA